MSIIQDPTPPPHPLRPLPPPALSVSLLPDTPPPPVLQVVGSGRQGRPPTGHRLVEHFDVTMHIHRSLVARDEATPLLKCSGDIKQLTVLPLPALGRVALGGGERLPHNHRKHF